MFAKSLICLFASFALAYADDTCKVSNPYIYYPELEMSYKFYAQALTWGKARESCISDNATLAIPKNAAERDAIMKIFFKYQPLQIIGASLNNHVFLGFHDSFEENEFVADLGRHEKYYSIDYYYRDFDIAEPNGGRGENFVTMERNGKYHSYPNAWTAAYICQRDHTEYVPDVLHHASDPGYKLHRETQKRFKLHVDLKTWGVAQSICYAEGGKLATILNKNEEKFLTNMLIEASKDIRHSSLTGSAWVGYHDMFVEGQFLSLEGAAMDHVGWSIGQPNGGAAENCVSISTTGETQDIPCHYTIMYFCEM